ncbi:male sterility domain containing protein [Aspergillus niger]|uniref:Fatty acyl-CoA reductase n=1 Tax=Aspergillus niger TaxID=5061 RepID=A0A124BYE3_ASPNG|nr:male sterility domain containing protein [Aspergillus niger]
MWEFFSQKTIFVTGGTGFLGSALVLRLVSQARPKCIYLLCRGGKHRAVQKWQKILPKPMSETLISSDLITYLDGDIQEPNLALPPTSLTLLKTTTEIIIHAASSINLVDPLHKLSQSIIGATERLAHFALSCPHLHRFVYISSAFANSHLYAEASSRAAVDISVRETLYPLHPSSPSSASPSISTATIYKELQSRGTTTEYESRSHDFPWPYAYAKHLSERLLLQAFNQNHDQSPNHNHTHDAFPNKLLIIRPSIFGPAQNFPYRGYSVPLSTPLTTIATMVSLTPSIRFHAATRAKNPDTEVTADEVPVDVVVDRTLFHLAYGSHCTLHAVCGERGRYAFKELWDDGMAVRKMPWRLRMTWLDVDWHSPRLHYIARLFVLYGMSFNFSEEKTVELWDRVPEDQRQGLNVFKDYSRGLGLVDRKEDMRVCARALMGYFGYPKWIRSLL